MKIRARKYRSGKVGWQLDVGKVSGKRVQIAFGKRKDAEAHAQKLKDEKTRHGHGALRMTHEERLRFAAAEARLREAGVSIEQAVEWALERTSAVREKLLLPKVVARFIADRRAKNKRDRYVAQLKVSLGGFALLHPELPGHLVTREIVTRWLAGNGWAPRTQANYLGDLRACCAWAMREGYMSHNPAKGIETPEVDEKEVEIFTPEQIGRLLTTALNHRGRRWNRGANTYAEDFVFRELLGFVVLATFAGIRPEEVKRSPSKVIDLDERTVLITGRRAKTRRRRVVDLPENAVAWLRLWQRLCPGQEMIVPKNFLRKWQACREAAKLAPASWAVRRYHAATEEIAPWPPDVLRHTAATMHYALHQNLALLQAQLGHHEDEDTLFRHYRAVVMSDGRPVTKGIAAQFYAILPPA